MSLTPQPCRWTSTVTPRALLDRHVDPLPAGHPADCPGCEPCAADHCLQCGVVHTTEANPRTCPACIADTRADLARIVDAWSDLPDAAMHGPAATAALPGGDATVMLGPGSLGEAANEDRPDHPGRLDHVADESLADPIPPLLVLATWEDDWRELRDLPAGERATVEAAAGFLADHLGWAAQEHPAYDEFVRDIASLRGRLEAVTGRGSSDAHDETMCVRCGAHLRRLARDVSCSRGHAQPVAGCCTGGLADDWECPRCHRRYTPAMFAVARLAHWRSQATALPASEIRLLLGVSGSTLRSWVRRGYVRRRRLIGGRIGYIVDDVRARLDTPEQVAG